MESSIIFGSDGGALPIMQGRVKWYDDQRAYGFILPLQVSENDEEADIFVHVSNLCPAVCRRPTLYTGEYVQFQVERTLGSDGSVSGYKARRVTGIGGGPLLCDHGKITFNAYSYLNFSNRETQDVSDIGSAELTTTTEAPMADGLVAAPDIVTTPV